MLRVRIIPCLLLKNKGLVKTRAFKKGKYVGDPINTVRIFNEKFVDEIVFLDIDASSASAEPNYSLFQQIASEAFMPLAYGGGIREVKQAVKMIAMGAEKIVINSHALARPELVRELSLELGRQSVVVAIDIVKDLFGRWRVYDHRRSKKTSLAPSNWAKTVQDLGAGEIFVNVVHRDGTMKGYDIPAIRQVTGVVQIPVIACGGASNYNDLGRVVKDGGAAAAAAGALFVYEGPHQAILINYPDDSILHQLFGDRI